MQLLPMQPQAMNVNLQFAGQLLQHNLVVATTTDQLFYATAMQNNPSSQPPVLVINAVSAHAPAPAHFGDPGASSSGTQPIPLRSGRTSKPEHCRSSCDSQKRKKDELRKL